MINPRGSTGYGQKFTDEITDDWGGKVYEDLMKGTDFVLAKYPFVDASRVAAAGGSYGGYNGDWIAARTGRLQTLLQPARGFRQTGICGATRQRWVVRDLQLGELAWSTLNTH